MEIKTILSILAALAFLYFVYGPGSRMLKKKSHHHILPPLPTSDVNWNPVNFDVYEKYIFVALGNGPENLRILTNL